MAIPIALWGTCQWRCVPQCSSYDTIQWHKCCWKSTSMHKTKHSANFLNVIQSDTFCLHCRVKFCGWIWNSRDRLSYDNHLSPVADPSGSTGSLTDNTHYHSNDISDQSSTDDDEHILWNDDFYSCAYINATVLHGSVFSEALNTTPV